MAALLGLPCHPHVRHNPTFALKIPLPDVVSMQTRQANLEGTGEIKLRRLVKEALRMRPDRIVVGEVRQEECLDVLMVPLVYLLTTVFQVQRAAFGVTEAARQAGRAYATAATPAEGAARASAAAGLALGDQGLQLAEPVEVSAPDGVEPGAQVRVVVRHRVALPLLGGLFGDVVPPNIPVEASHLAVVDRFRDS